MGSCWEGVRVMVYGVRDGSAAGIGEGLDGDLVVVPKAAGSFEGEAGVVEVGVFEPPVFVVAGEGMAFARATLSRRSWRMALRCLRWSLSRRDTLEAALSWCCTEGGGEAKREGRSMARSREVGGGAIADDSVDVDIAVGRERDRPQQERP